MVEPDSEMTRLSLVGRKRLAVQLAIALTIGLLIGYMLGSAPLQPEAPYRPAEYRDLPEDLEAQLDRFTFVNRSTNETLKEFRVIGKTVGAYDEGGTIFETYVVGFEDRFRGAEPDQDFLDLMVELKRARGSSSITVRIVQLGLDTIEVYLDGRFLGSVRPTIEVQISK